MSAPIVFPQDVQINDNSPGLEYNGTEGSSVWHEDREIAGVMYRVSNASYVENTLLWKQPDQSQPSYAVAQNTDGSVNYLYKPPGQSSGWATSAWQGTGQHGVYNAVNYGLNVNDTAGTDNQMALQSALTAIFDSGMPGTLVLPPGMYYINGTVGLAVSGNDPGIIIAGSGGGTTLVQLAIGPTFNFTGCSSGNGIRIRDLIIAYSTKEGNLSIPGPALYTTSSQNITCSRVFFSNCIAADFDDMSLQCGLLECTVDYEIGVDSQVMITLSGSENYVDNCTIRQKPLDKPNAPLSCTAIAVQPQGGGVYITNCHISDFDTGIVLTGASVNLLHGFLSNLHVESNVTAVLLQPSDSSAKVYQVFFDDCVFARTPTSTSVSAGVKVDPVTNGGSISDIFFNNCMCHDWAGPGLEITGGQDIVITGGRFGQNATDSSMATSGAIAVTGAAVRVIIVGADCSGEIPSYQSQPPAENPQPYSISVTGEVTGMLVSACNLTNNGIGPIYAPNNGTDLWVSNCRGYNDQVKQLATSAPASGVRFNGTSYGYYGPSTFYISGGPTAIKVANSPSASAPSITTGLMAGAFRLDLGEWAELDYPGGIPSFVLVGT